MCGEEQKSGLTVQGCARHFATECMGSCWGCLGGEHVAKSILQGSFRHGHTLSDGTRHLCNFPPDSVLASLEREKNLLTAESKMLKAPRHRSAHRGYRQRMDQRRLEVQSRLKVVTALAGKLQGGLAPMAGARAAADLTPGLCRTCGGYPRNLEGEAATLAQLATQGATWIHACPGCLSYTEIASTTNCSVVTCEVCLEEGGRATRYCVVCRMTSRGNQEVFPGKAGLPHPECVPVMRKHVADPGAVGAHALCTCPGPEGPEPPAE
jgi:hypothetical protein